MKVKMITVKFLVPDDFETTSENIMKSKSLMLDSLKYLLALSEQDMEAEEVAIIKGLIKEY